MRHGPAPTEGADRSRNVHVVAVPGLGLDGRAWEPTLQGLRGRLAEASTRSLLLPGFGRAAAPEDRLEPEALGHQTVGLIGAAPRVVLLGHSASCQLVAHAAAMSASVVAVVLVGPTTDPRSTTWPTLARRWLATARHETPAEIPTLARQYRRTGLGTMRRAMEAARADRIESTLERVECPVLLLRGALDRIAPADWLAQLASAGPAPVVRRRVDLTEGGHMVPLTHARHVTGAVVDFLLDIPAR